MKTASTVTRFVGLGFSILTLCLWVYYFFSVAFPILFSFFANFVVTILFFWIAPIILLLIAGVFTYPVLVAIKAVVGLSKNKSTIAVGVMMITTSVFALDLFFFPIIAGVLIILSAVFRKKAEEKEKNK